MKNPQLIGAYTFLDFALRDARDIYSYLISFKTNLSTMPEVTPAEMAVDSDYKEFNDILQGSKYLTDKIIKILDHMVLKLSAAQGSFSSKILA